MSKRDHTKDDIRGNVMIKCGFVTEERNYLKVRVGNNPDEVSVFRKSLKDGAGIDAKTPCIYAYFPKKPKRNSEHLVQAKDGGFWIDWYKFNEEIGKENNQLPKIDPNELTGELFLEFSMATDDPLTKGAYNSFEARLSFDGSHEFAQTLGKMLVKNRILPFHPDFLVNMVRKFKDIDMTLNIDPMTTLSKKDITTFFSDPHEDDKVFDELFGRAIRRNPYDNVDKIEEALAEGVRFVVLFNENLYMNVDVKVEKASQAFPSEVMR